jgi:hypothetical protein
MTETLTCKETVALERTARFRTIHLSHHPLLTTNAKCHRQGNTFFNRTLLCSYIYVILKRKILVRLNYYVFFPNFPIHALMNHIYVQRIYLLTLILLTWKMWWAPHNAGRWQVGFNSAFKGWNYYVVFPNFPIQALMNYIYVHRIYLLTLILLTWRIRWAPNNASRWQVGFNSAFKGLIFCGVKFGVLL